MGTSSLARVSGVLLSTVLALGACGDGGPGGGDGGGPGGGGGDGGGGWPPDGDMARSMPQIPSGHPRIYLNATNRARLTAQLGSSDPAAMRFKSIVDAAVGGADIYEYKAWFSALVGQLTGDARYCTDAISRVDGWVRGEEALIANNQRAKIAGDNYLEVGPIVGDLALTYDWCYDALTDGQRARWLAYADQAVWNVWNHEQARWGNTTYDWTGWSVDNPVNNYYYSFLRATMLLGLAAHGELPRDADWVKMFRETKIRDQLVPVFARDLVGGGSREGTGYGTAMKELFSLYDLWEASTGERIHDLTPHAQASLGYLIHATVPTADRLAPIGDHARDSTAALFDYHRQYALELMSLYSGSPLAGVAQTWLAGSSVPQVEQHFMKVYDFLYAPRETARPLDELSRVYWGAGTGHLFARSSWERDATWLGFIAGPYTESHAHHDQLSLLVYKREWLADDANIDSHSGIHQEEELHNLVRLTVGGNVVRQREGTSSRLVALADDARFLYAAADGAPVYGATGDVTTMQRELVWLKPNVAVVFDRVAGPASGSSTKTWQLNVQSAPAIAAGNATMQGASSKLTLWNVAPGSAVAPTSVSWPTADSDVQRGHRLEIAQSGTGVAYFLQVLAIDDAVTAAVAASAAGKRGVTLTLADASTVTVRFAESAFGGELTFGNGTTALPTGVTVPPLFR